MEVKRKALEGIVSKPAPASNERPQPTEESRSMPSLLSFGAIDWRRRP